METTNKTTEDDYGGVSHGKKSLVEEWAGKETATGQSRTFQFSKVPSTGA